MTLRCSRWRLLQQHANAGQLFRIKGMGPVYRWLYKRVLIRSCDPNGSMFSELTPLGRVWLAHAVKEHARHNRSSPWVPWGDPKRRAC